VFSLFRKDVEDWLKTQIPLGPSRRVTTRQCRDVTLRACRAHIPTWPSSIIVIFLRKFPIWFRIPSLRTASITFFGDSRSVVILTQCTNQDNKRVIYNKTFALLFAANDVNSASYGTPHLCDAASAL